MNAIAYIEEKYGFTAEVDNAILEYEYGIYTSSPLSTVLVYMNYNGKSFHTYISGEGKNTDGADDYQYDILAIAFAEYMKQKVDGVYAVDIQSGIGRKIVYDEIEYDCDHLFSTFFDGENLSEVLYADGSTMIIKCINADLSNQTYEDYKDILIEDKMYIYLISFSSEEAYQTCNGDRIYDAEHYDYENNSVYIESYCKLRGGKAEYHELMLNNAPTI